MVYPHRTWARVGKRYVRPQVGDICFFFCCHCHCCCYKMYWMARVWLEFCIILSEPYTHGSPCLARTTKQFLHNLAVSTPINNFGKYVFNVHCKVSRTFFFARFFLCFSVLLSLLWCAPTYFPFSIDICIFTSLETDTINWFGAGGIQMLFVYKQIIMIYQ